MSKSQPIGRSLVLASIVALGLSFAWLAVAFWAIMIGAQSDFWRGTTEMLYVRLDGRLFLYRISGGSKPSVSTVTLEGETVDDSDYQQFLHSADLQPQASSIVNPLLAQDWNSRLSSASDGRTPANYWYLVHDGQVNGRAFGVGFNTVTKRVIGYFGRQGVSDLPPPRDDWFQVAGEAGLTNAVVTTWGYEPAYYQASDALIVLAEGKLWRFNTQSRQVKVLFDAPRAMALGQAWIALDKLPSTPPGVMPQPAQYLTRQKIVVRSPDDITIVDPLSQEKTTLPIPANMKKAPFSVYELAGGEWLLITRAGYVEKRGHHLVWLGQDGAVQREKNVTLAQNSHGGNELTLAGWCVAAAAPHPLSHLVLLLGAPLFMIQSGETESYSAGLFRAAGETALSLLAVILVGTVGAIFAYRRQRRFGLPHAAAWAAFVFVLGIPGWIAYRFHRTWPVLEECPACHQPSPRDREECLDCGKPFPLPPLKGIEVFAPAA